jgi:hypothetical protein
MQLSKDRAHAMHRWSPHDSVGRRNASTVFSLMTKRGYRAFSVDVAAPSCSRRSAAALVDLSIRTAAIPRPVAFTDVEKTFVSEASVYRILKAEGLVTSPAFIVMKAAAAFANPTTAINQLWQTDFTYLKVIGWGWICRQCSTTSPATSLPGRSAPR